MDPRSPVKYPVLEELLRQSCLIRQGSLNIEKFELDKNGHGYMDLTNPAFSTALKNLTIAETELDESGPGYINPTILEDFLNFRPENVHFTNKREASSPPPYTRARKRERIHELEPEPEPEPEPELESEINLSGIGGFNRERRILRARWAKKVEENGEENGEEKGEEKEEDFEVRV